MVASGRVVSEGCRITWITRIVIVTVGALLACVSLVLAAALAPALAQEGDEEDRTSPLILHQTQEIPVVAGYPVEVGAKVTDNVRVAKVQLFYRLPGEAKYTVGEMMRQGADEYAGQIPSAEVTVRGVEYFMIARDGAGNLTLLGSATAPVFMTVRPPAKESPLQRPLELAWYQEGWFLSLVGAVVVTAVAVASL